MIPVECVGRVYLTGSGFKGYNPDTGEFGVEADSDDPSNKEDWGYSPLPRGLHDGSELPQILFTPTSKAEAGHDLPVSREWVKEQFGLEPERLTLALLARAVEFARDKGILVADTKFELGKDGNNEQALLLVADEVLTPDSSRFWDAQEHAAAKAKRKAPSGWDKQPVRDAMSQIQTPFGVTANKLKPSVPEHVAWVHNEMQMPEGVVMVTSPRYTGILRRLVGRDLEVFQYHVMGADD